MLLYKGAPMPYTYVYFCPITEDPIYVGKGTDRRAQWHIENCEDPPEKANKWFMSRLRKIKAAGLEPRIEIVLDDVSSREALDKEIELIALYKRKSKGGTLYNLTDGGESTVGYKAPPDVIEKWRECKSGDKNPMYGKSSSGSKGMTWWNNGTDKVLAFECPPGWVKGYGKRNKPAWNSGKKLVNRTINQSDIIAEEN
jgi:hypothetical protein